MKRTVFVAWSILSILGLNVLGGRLKASQTALGIPEDVKSIFKKNCAACHKGVFAPKHLKLGPNELPAAVLNVPSREKPEFMLVDTASPEASYLLKKIKGDKEIARKIMPPPGRTPLAAEEIARIEAWIVSQKDNR